LIIEFGSGTSTLLILRTLELLGSDQNPLTNGSPLLLSFEHSDFHYHATLDLVKRCVNHNQLDLRLDPLSSWSDSTGDYNYYACHQAISDALRSLVCLSLQSETPRTLKLLVLINGPSDSTGRWARYPAVPLVLNASSSMDADIDFLADDMQNDEGRELALTWEDSFNLFNLEYQRDSSTLGNSGLLLRLKGLASKDTSLDRRDALLAERGNQEAIASDWRMPSSLL
jgi:hypothetical protein